MFLCEPFCATNVLKFVLSELSVTLDAESPVGIDENTGKGTAIVDCTEQQGPVKKVSMNIAG